MTGLFNRARLASSQPRPPSSSLNPDAGRKCVGANLGNRHWREKTSDGETTTEMAYQPSEGKLHVRTSQTNPRAAAEANAKLRQHSADHKELRRGVRIPEHHWPEVVRQWPGLVRGTPEEQQSALTQISIAHPEWITIQFTPRYR